MKPKIPKWLKEVASKSDLQDLSELPDIDADDFYVCIDGAKTNARDVYVWIEVDGKWSEDSVLCASSSLEHSGDVENKITYSNDLNLDCLTVIAPQKPVEGQYFESATDFTQRGKRYSKGTALYFYKGVWEVAQCSIRDRFEQHLADMKYSREQFILIDNKYADERVHDLWLTWNAAKKIYQGWST